MLEAIKNKILAECQTDVCKQNFLKLIENLKHSSKFDEILGSPLLVLFLNKYSDNLWVEREVNSGGAVLYFSEKPMLYNSLENFERILCLIDLFAELKLLEVEFLPLLSRVDTAHDKNNGTSLETAFNTALENIQKKIRETNNAKLSVYLGIPLEKLVETHKKNNAIQPDLNVPPQSQNDPTNSANQTSTQKKIPIPLVVNCLQDYCKSQNLKLTQTGPTSYEITKGSVIKFTCTIDGNGGLSLKTDKVDRAPLEKMIEMLAAKITANNELREVVLSGDPDAIKIMKDKCLALNLKVVDPTQTKNNTPPKTPVNNGNQLITGAGSGHSSSPGFSRN